MFQTSLPAERAGFQNSRALDAKLEANGSDSSSLRLVDYRYPTFLGRWQRPLPEKQKNFVYDDMDEPHIKRKHAILSRYPKVTSLYGYEPLTKYVSLAVVAVQLSVAIFFGRVFTPQNFAENFINWSTAWYWAMFLCCAYVVGGTLSAMIGVIIHEIAHSLCFKSHFANRLLGLFVNVPLTVPIAMSFRRYHLDHHAYQGVKSKDPDLPMDWEVSLIKGNAVTKALWVLIYPLMYCVRGMAFKKLPTRWELINATTTLLSDCLVAHFAGWRGLLYLFLSLWFGYSLHPGAAHFIQEHYTFVSGQETYSYYGLLNIPMLNIGLHNEHHDFTKIPWSRLPQLHAIANEFYSSLHAHTSWVLVLIAFIFDKELAALSRCARDIETHAKGRALIPKLVREMSRLVAESTSAKVKSTCKVDEKMDVLPDTHFKADQGLMDEIGGIVATSDIREGEEEMELVERAMASVVDFNADYQKSKSL